MPRIHPLHLFPPHITERGLLYFQQGKQAVAYIKPRACLRAHTLPMNHKEFEIYV
ncbi:hypothetical protein [Neisseria sp. P0009.S007]|uniref:hypothetical protein n=1 Tax=unclassified Neisseria TaxID=2623750 RepID=UPI003F808CF3